MHKHYGERLNFVSWRPKFGLKMKKLPSTMFSPSGGLVAVRAKNKSFSSLYVSCCLWLCSYVNCASLFCPLDWKIWKKGVHLPSPRRNQGRSVWKWTTYVVYNTSFVSDFSPPQVVTPRTSGSPKPASEGSSSSTDCVTIQVTALFSLQYVSYNYISRKCTWTNYNQNSYEGYNNIHTFIMTDRDRLCNGSWFHGFMHAHEFWISYSIRFIKLKKTFLCVSHLYG